MRMLPSTVAACAVLVLTGAAASCARAQDPLPVVRVGERVSGRLTESDPAVAGRGRIKIYQFQGREGVWYRATLQSDAFDTHLMLGQRLNGITDYPLNREASGGAVQGPARMAFTPPASGTFLLIVQSAREEGTGAFTLALDSTAVPRPPCSGPTLEAGETRGAFAAGDARHPDQPARFVDYLEFSGQAGRRVRITARSTLQPLLLEVGRRGHTDCTLLARAPAGGALDFTLLSGGPHYVRVASPPGATGEYTLTLEDRPSAAPSPPATGTAAP